MCVVMRNAVKMEIVEIVSKVIGFLLARMIIWKLINKTAFAPRSYVDAGGEASVIPYVYFYTLNFTVLKSQIQKLKFRLLMSKNSLISFHC